MRIRKNARILTVPDSSAATPPESHFCQLNQSPWDVITFSPPRLSFTPPPPPPLHQVDEDFSFTDNGSLGDSIGAVESVASMKISEEEEDDNGRKWVFSGGGGGEEDGGDGYVEEEKLRRQPAGEILCCKTNGKGWQCQNEAREGNSLCDHHLGQLRNYGNPTSTSSATAAAKPPVDHNRRRPRQKKATSSNPHEFYYYSGFGPRWGKKRGPAEPESTRITSSTESPQPIAAAAAAKTTAMPPCFIIEEEDEDDEEDEDHKKGKKKARKLIKARSLKSLM